MRREWMTHDTGPAGPAPNNDIWRFSSVWSQSRGAWFGGAGERTLEAIDHKSWLYSATRPITEGDQCHDPHNSLFRVNATAPTSMRAPFPGSQPSNSLPTFTPPTDDDVRKAIPHPNAYYCPEENGWVLFRWDSSFVTPPFSQRSSSTNRHNPQKRTRSCIGGGKQPFGHHFHKYAKAVDARELTPPFQRDEWQTFGNFKAKPGTVMVDDMGLEYVDVLDERQMQQGLEGGKKILDLYVCCHCSFCCVASGVIPGVIPCLLWEHFVQEMESSSPPGKAGALRLMTVLEALIMIIENKLWNNECRGLRVLRPGFQSKVGWNQTIKCIFEILGFKAANFDNDIVLFPPGIDLAISPSQARQNRAKLLRAWIEISAWAVDFQHTYVNQFKGRVGHKLCLTIDSATEMYQTAIGMHPDQNFLIFPSTVPIHHALPVELLSWIFKIGALMPADHTELPFPLLVSRICRHWRHIAISTSNIWTNIQWYISLRPFPAIWFERSKSCLLDITLHTLYSDNYEFDLSPLIPHMDRCRRLTINAEDHDELVELARPLEEVFAPCLEHVEVRLTENHVEYDPTQQHFLAGGTPHLRSVRLRGAWSLVQPTLVRVQTLDLHEWQPMPTQFRLLAASSSLTTLILRDCMLLDEEEDEEYPVIEIPSLLILAISYPKSSRWAYPEPDDCLFNHLSLPNLEYLEIVHATIHDLISNFPIDPQKLHYPKLKMLRLDSLQLGKDDMGDLLFRALPTVSHLQIINGTKGEYILPARSISRMASHEANSSRTATAESPRWPNLHTITLETAPEDNIIWLCNIVSARIETGKPLGKVRFSAVSYADFKLYHKAWFEVRIEVDVVGEDEILGIIQPHNEGCEGGDR